MRTDRRAAPFWRIVAALLATGALSFAGTPSGAQTPQGAPLVLEAKIPLGDVKGRIDHMAFDPARNRLFVAELENNTLGIVDLAARKVVHVVTGLSEPQGVAYEPSTDTLYVANGGDGSVRLYRAMDFAEAGRIDLGDDADNIRIDPATRRVLVGYGSGAIATIDPATRAKLADFPLPAHPESFQLDVKSNQIFVNVPRRRSIVVLDGASGRQLSMWPVKEGGANFPMALEEAAQRIFVALRAPPRLLVLSGGGEAVASVELCGDSDDTFLDPKRARVYVSCGEGFLDVFDARAGNYARVAHLPTSQGARTSYFAAPIDRLFLAVRATTTEPAAVWVYRPSP